MGPGFLDPEDKNLSGASSISALEMMKMPGADNKFVFILLERKRGGF